MHGRVADVPLIQVATALRYLVARGPFAARLFAAALLGIGIESLLGRNTSVEAYRAMLNLKIIFSGSAILGILITMSAGGPPLAWLFLGVFVVFCAVWVTYRLRLRLAAEGPTR